MAMLIQKNDERYAGIFAAKSGGVFPAGVFSWDACPLLLHAEAATTKCLSMSAPQSPLVGRNVSSWRQGGHQEEAEDQKMRRRSRAAADLAFARS